MYRDYRPGMTCVTMVLQGHDVVTLVYRDTLTMGPTWYGYSMYHPGMTFVTIWYYSEDKGYDMAPLDMYANGSQMDVNSSNFDSLVWQKRGALSEENKCPQTTTTIYYMHVQG